MMSLLPPPAYPDIFQDTFKTCFSPALVQQPCVVLLLLSCRSRGSAQAIQAAGTARRVLAAEETAGKGWGRQGSVSVFLSDPRAHAFAFSDIIPFPFCYVSIVCWRNDAIKSTESGGKMFWYEGMCMCVCMSSIKKKHTHKPSAYLAASFNLCLACKREIHLQIFLAVNLLYLYWCGTKRGVLFQGCRSPSLW